MQLLIIFLNNYIVIANVHSDFFVILSIGTLYLILLVGGRFWALFKLTAGFVINILVGLPLTCLKYFTTLQVSR